MATTFPADKRYANALQPPAPPVLEKDTPKKSISQHGSGIEITSTNNTAGWTNSNATTLSPLYNSHTSCEHTSLVALHTKRIAAAAFNGVGDLPKTQMYYPFVSPAFLISRIFVPNASRWLGLKKLPHSSQMNIVLDLSIHPRLRSSH